MLAPAFPAPVVANQVVFRAVMDAVARPGEVRALPPVVGAPSPLSATAAALALALLPRRRYGSIHRWRRCRRSPNGSAFIPGRA